MIVVRNVFRLKFGKSREAVALWKDGHALAGRLGFATGSMRLLTDLVAPFYTLVVEHGFESLADYERQTRALMGNQQWKDWYAKVVPLIESGEREIFTLID